MTTTIYSPNIGTILIDALCDICEIVVAPLEMLSAILGTLAAVLGLVWGNRRYILTTAAVVGFCWLCWALPMLPVGLAITAVIGWATYPRTKAVRA